MPEMPDCRVDGQQFAPEGAVPLFGGCQFPGKESDWSPYSFDELLKCGTHSYVRCVDHDALRNSRLRVSEERGVGKMSLDLLEGRLGALRPVELLSGILGILSGTFVCRQQEVERL